MMIHIKKNRDIFLVLFFSWLVLLVIRHTVTASSGVAIWLRRVVGLSYVFFFSGYPLAHLFFPRHQPSRLLDRLVYSTGFSLLLTYPAGLINLVREGQSNVYQIHLPGVITNLVILTTIFTFLCLFMRRRWMINLSNVNILGKREATKLGLCFLSLIIVVSIFCNFYRLTRADLDGAEINIAFRAYDLIDGKIAGRKGLFISSVSHSPLLYYINHIAFQLLEPEGFYQLEDWMFRVAPAVLGVLIVLLTYLIGRRLFSEGIGLGAAFIIAINNHNIWVSRILLFETVLAFFILLAFYAFNEERRRERIKLTGIFLGASLFSKFTGFLLIPIFLFTSFYTARMKQFDSKQRIVNKPWWKEEEWLEQINILLIALIIFSPVIFYNIASYLKTGYMDQIFSKAGNLLGMPVGGGMIGDNDMYNSLVNPWQNLKVIIASLNDQYSFPLFSFFGLTLWSSLLLFPIEKMGIKKRILPFLIWIAVVTLFFMFNGVRAYYFLFLTPAFAILTSYLLWRLLSSRKASKLSHTFLLLFTAVIYLYAFYYSWQSNYSYSFTTDLGEKQGETGHPVIILKPQRHYSLVTRSWQEDRGCKQLRRFTRENVGVNDLLLVDYSMDNLRYRWYVKEKGLMIMKGEYLYLQDKIEGYPTVIRCGPKEYKYDVSDYANIYAIIKTGNEAQFHFLKNFSLFKEVTDSSGVSRFSIYKQ